MASTLRHERELMKFANNLESARTEEHRKNRGAHKAYAASAIYLTGALHPQRTKEPMEKAFEALKKAAEKRPERTEEIEEEREAISKHISKIRDFFETIPQKKNGKEPANSPKEFLLKMHNEMQNAFNEDSREMEKVFRKKRNMPAYPTKQEKEQLKKAQEEEKQAIRNLRQKHAKTFREKVKPVFQAMAKTGVPENDAKTIARYFSNNAHHVVTALKIIKGRDD